MRRNLLLASPFVAVIVLAALTVSILTFDPPSGAEGTTPTTEATVTVKGQTYTESQLAAWVAAVERHKIRQWVAAVERYKARLLWERIAAFAAAVERHQARQQAEAQRRAGGVWIEGIQVCNGTTLPTCGIVKRESGFNPRARNPRSTAGGLYQFLIGTFRGVCPADAARYGNAAYAPVSVQVRCARILWNNGRGASHWRLTL